MRCRRGAEAPLRAEAPPKVNEPLLALLCNAEGGRKLRPCSARVVWLLPHPLEPLERSLLSCLGFDRQAESLTSATTVAESISECIFPTG
jgi:hypothetical protein